MEDLTKTQLILLTLLVSFVTSIATGIMTVSLLSEAPANVTQTINRVVERTIERVVTEGGTETIREVQVVNTDDQVVAAITKNAKTTVRVRRVGIDGQMSLYAIGLYMGNGLVVSERTAAFTPSMIYAVSLPDGSTTPATFVKEDIANRVVVFRLEALPDGALTAASISDNPSQLGQTVVAIEGDAANAVAIGRVLNLSGEGEGQAARVIETDIRSDRRTPGAILVNLSGGVLGFRTSEVEHGGVFAPARFLRSALEGI